MINGPRSAGDRSNTASTRHHIGAGGGTAPLPGGARLLQILTGEEPADTVLLQAIRSLSGLWRHVHNRNGGGLDARSEQVEAILVWVIKRQAARALGERPDTQSIRQQMIDAYCDHVTLLARHHAAMQRALAEADSTGGAAQLNTLINEIDVLAQALDAPGRYRTTNSAPS